MKLYVFKSEISEDLRAFAANKDGSDLPSQFAPWLPNGSIAATAQPPYGLSRFRIESAIKLKGFQLWRLKRPAADDADAR